MQVFHRILEIIGGTTVVGAAVWAFLGNLIRDYLKERWKGKTDIQTDKAKGMNAIQQIQPEQYTRHQYEVCVALWKLLGQLRDAVDTLWDHVTKENIVALNQQLRSVHTQLYAWSLFFEERHLMQLEDAIRVLGDFSAGKTRLWELRSQEQIADFEEVMLQRQIDQNRHYKEQFEHLIMEVQNSLRQKLSGHPGEHDLVKSN